MTYADQCKTCTWCKEMIEFKIYDSQGEEIKEKAYNVKCSHKEHICANITMTEAVIKKGKHTCKYRKTVKWGKRGNVLYL